MKHSFVPLILLIAIGAGCTASNTSLDLQKKNKITPPETARASTADTEIAPNKPNPSIKREAVLNLSGKGLTKIPSEIFARSDLEQLDLSMNELTDAPQAEIRRLANLKVLNLSGNALTGLPAELGQLQHLEVLDVSNNQLTGLPLELGNLTQLRILDLRGNTYSTKDLDQISAKLKHTEIRR